MRAVDQRGPDAGADEADPAYISSVQGLGACSTWLCSFLGVDVEVGPDVLVPRAETELLGRTAIDIVQAVGATPVVIDMCCGSGNLAVALARRFPFAHITASDLTDGAVALARRNVDRLDLRRQVVVVQGDMFAADDLARLAGRADLVMCNPPYISSKRLAGDRAYLLEHEPREAFDGGPYGVSIHQRLVRDAIRFLKPGGWLAFEFGHGQERLAAGLIARTGAYGLVELRCDETGAPRVAVARRAG